MSEKQINGKLDKIIEGIDELNLGQVSELIDKIKGKYNIQETALVQATDGDTQTSEKKEEKAVNVSLKLLDVGAQKVQIYNIIKTAVKELSGDDINIIEAKKITEKEGGVIFENIAWEKADSIKKQLEEKGAKVEIK